MKFLRFEGAVEATDDLYALACKHDQRVSMYSACIVDGVRFTVKEQDDRRTTQNSGVGVVVYDGNDDDNVDAGELDERQ